MKTVPTISPELHGLLDEIVSDPRSALRLTPRRALLPWIDSGDVLSSRPLDATKAERHLLAVHREELAKLLLDGAILSHQHALVLSHPLRGRGSRLVDSAELRHAISEKVASGKHRFSSDSAGLVLLSKCLLDPSAADAGHLAKASLALAPSDKARFYAAMTVPWTDPLSAIAILDRLLASKAPSSIRVHAWNSLGARCLALGWIAIAREQYARSVDEDWHAASACYLFNLSCFLGDSGTALRQSHLLDESANSDGWVAEAAEIIRHWLPSVPYRRVQCARSLARSMRARLSPRALRIAAALEVDGAA